MNKVTANTVADYFLAYAREHGDYITNLKLQKLLYYAQAWFLALYDEPLFEDELEAWVHGPAIPDVYRRFKAFSYNPIVTETAKPSLPLKARRLVQEVFQKYGRFTAVDLERMTHEEAPWILARGNLPADKNSEQVVEKETIKSFFKAKLQHG